MTTRRHFLRASFAGLMAARFGHAAETPPVKSKPDVILYEGSYPGWPWVTAGADGTLYCAFREGTEHGFSATGRALLCTSKDKGRTWSGATVIVDAPGVDDRNVRRDAKGKNRENPWQRP